MLKTASLEATMRRAVTRERNKRYYRALHVPIWIWVFFILPGPLTYRLYVQGPSRAHWIWLAIVIPLCAWRGHVGRLPGAELAPYVVYYGAHLPNLPYRVVCYTAAWIDLLVPFSLNLAGLVAAVATGRWPLGALYARWYYPLAAVVVLAAALNGLPRTRRSTRGEGAERAWFYVALWTVVPAQAAGWALWRLGRDLHLPTAALNAGRLGVFIAVTVAFLALGLSQRLPRTARYYGDVPVPAPAGI